MAALGVGINLTSVLRKQKKADDRKVKTADKCEKIKLSGKAEKRNEKLLLKKLNNK